jgi:hypothetical protein
LLHEGRVQVFEGGKTGWSDATIETHVGEPLGKLDDSKVVRLIRGLIPSVIQLWHEGIVHGDLVPANVIRRSPPTEEFVPEPDRPSELEIELPMRSRLASDDWMQSPDRMSLGERSEVEMRAEAEQEGGMKQGAGMVSAEPMQLRSQLESVWTQPSKLLSGGGVELNLRPGEGRKEGKVLVEEPEFGLVDFDGAYIQNPREEESLVGLDKLPVVNFLTQPYSEDGARRPSLSDSLLSVLILASIVRRGETTLPWGAAASEGNENAVSKAFHQSVEGFVTGKECWGLEGLPEEVLLVAQDIVRAWSEKRGVTVDVWIQRLQTAEETLKGEGVFDGSKNFRSVQLVKE